MVSIVLMAWVGPAGAAQAQAAGGDSPAALRITGGPYLQAPSPAGMTLVWTTSSKSTAKVEYGPSADALTSVAVSARHGLIDANTTLHRVTLRGLQPGTTYHYRVVSTEILEFRPYRVRFGSTAQARGTRRW